MQVLKDNVKEGCHDDGFKSRTDPPMTLYCHQIKIGDIFVLNTYKDKLCIKMIEFPREIDWNLHHQHDTVKLDFKELLNKEQIDFKELYTGYLPLLYHKSTVK